jgi:hypothetical protein
MSQIVLVSPDTNDQEFSPIVERARALVVTNVEEHGTALVVLGKLAAAEKRIKDIFEEPKKAAFSAHRAITGAESKLLGPISEAKALVAGKATVFEVEETRKAEEDLRRRQAEARKIEEERQLLDAIAADESGDKEGAAAILAAPTEVPVLSAAPNLATVAGIGSRTTWGARVSSLSALIKYVAEHPEWENLLEPNLPALNKLAQAQHEKLGIPGVVAEKTVGKTVRAVK